jgi:hypothetical protein
MHLYPFRPVPAGRDAGWRQAGRQGLHSNCEAFAELTPKTRNPASAEVICALTSRWAQRTARVIWPRDHQNERSNRRILLRYTLVENGPKRHFAAAQQTVAFGGYSDRVDLQGNCTFLASSRADPSSPDVKPVSLANHLSRLCVA